MIQPLASTQHGGDGQRANIYFRRFGLMLHAPTV